MMVSVCVLGSEAIAAASLTGWVADWVDVAAFRVYLRGHFSCNWCKLCDTSVNGSAICAWAYTGGNKAPVNCYVTRLTQRRNSTWTALVCKLTRLWEEIYIWGSSNVFHCHVRPAKVIWGKRRKKRGTWTWCSVSSAFRKPCRYRGCCQGSTMRACALVASSCTF